MNILVVEDEQDIRDLVSIQLEKEGYTVDAVNEGKEGLMALSRKEYDLLVLDWMLPEMSGLSITKLVRGENQKKTSPQVPILMITAKAEPLDIIQGLETGVDDYITKPFELTVLMARVKALLRRAEMQKKPGIHNEHLGFGKIRILSSSYEVYLNDKKLHLTKSEFKLLEALAQNKGKVLTRDQLIHLIQGQDVAVTPRTVDTHIFGLRKKLEDQSEYIETIRGVGYRVIFDS